MVDKKIDIEKLLSNKLDELAENVDCFGKITDRAFPKTGTKDTENWFTVTGLENVTVRSKRTKKLRWAALAAAAAVALMVIPKTEIIPKVLTHIVDNGKGTFESIIDHITDETQKGEFISFDVPLSYYITNDVLITPLLSCPFEDSGKEDTYVRLYIRTVDSYPTNEVYAIEYTGSFTDSGIIAAAYTDTKFTKEDIEQIELCDRIVPEEFSKEIDRAVEDNFWDDGMGNLALNGDNAVSLASFTLIQHIKTAEGLYPLAATDVIYYHNDARFQEEHYYDTFTYSATVYGNKEIEDLPEREFGWKRSVYRNGRSAFPEKNASSFTRTEIFGSEPTEEIPQKGWAAAAPLTFGNPVSELYGSKLELEYFHWYRQGTFSTVLSPAAYCANSFRMYTSPYKDGLYYSSSPSRTVKIMYNGKAIYSGAIGLSETSEAENVMMFSESYNEYVEESLIQMNAEYDRIVAELNANIAEKRSFLKALTDGADSDNEEIQKQIEQYDTEIEILKQQLAYCEQQQLIIEQYQAESEQSSSE